MRQIVLYLEDNASMRRYTTELLREQGYDLEDFRRVDQVKEFFPAHKDEIVCIITDLNMSDEWLDDHQVETEGGMLSGWVWLDRFVYPVKPNISTVIYSGYIHILEKYLASMGKLSALKKSNIICVSKGDDDDEGFSGLLDALQNTLRIEGRRL